MLFSALPQVKTQTESLFHKGQKRIRCRQICRGNREPLRGIQKTSCCQGLYTFYLSRAYSESGNISESDLRIKELLKDYPSSPLRKKARWLEIKNLISSGEMPHDTEILESYVRDYPEDHDRKFLFARHLKDKGETERAKAVLKPSISAATGCSRKYHTMNWQLLILPCRILLKRRLI